jgi:hypothetical protein
MFEEYDSKTFVIGIIVVGVAFLVALHFILPEGFYEGLNLVGSVGR